MSAVPLAKLGALLLRTVTKPIAKRLGERVKESQVFRNTFIRFGRGINNLQVSLAVSHLGVHSRCCCRGARLCGHGE